ncbi:MAG: hypothetical protein RL238_2804, partial [Actinomycetota bacterium]
TGCSADDSGGRAPCARSAYSDPMATGACVPNSASYNAMLKYDEWSACVKWSAGCPTKPSECGNCGWKILIFAGGAIAQAACGAADVATFGATFGCHALAAGATSWGMHAVDGDISINLEDILFAGAGGLFGVLGRYISRAGSATTEAGYSPSKISINEEALDKVFQTHLADGPLSAGKSTFYDNVTITRLIADADSVTPVVQSGSGNLQYIVDAGRVVGIDRATGQATSIYTVVTKSGGQLVTAFPGTPP